MRQLSRVIDWNTALKKPTELSYLAALSLLAFTSPAQAAGALFCCHGTNGMQVCGDTLPKECYGRAYREIGSSGRTIRQVEAPLTAEQRAQRDAEEEKRKIEEAARKEQQRKDQALLNTYSSEQDIETMRQRAKDDVQKSIRNAEAKIVEIRKQRKKYEDEAEFYKKKQLPAEVQKGLDNSDYEIKAQESVIEAKKKELDIIREKYDEDRRRFIALTRNKAGSAAQR